MASQEERYCEDVAPGRPLSPMARLSHAAGLSAVLAQKERSRYACARVDICVFVCL